MSRSKVGKQNLLEFAVKFHGHLGPYLVLGLRMGMAAIRILKPHGLHELSVKVWTKITPPESCLVDGIQVSSGCTLGKANTSVKDSRRIGAEFRKADRRVVIRLSEKSKRTLGSLKKPTPQITLNELATSLYRAPDRQLFVINR